MCQSTGRAVPKPFYRSAQVGERPNARATESRKLRGWPGVRKRSSAPPAPWFRLNVPKAAYEVSRTFCRTPLISHFPTG